MWLAWWLNVAGLGLTTVAAMLMYFFPPAVISYTAKGEGAVTFVGNPSEEGKRIGIRQRRYSKAAILLLAIGFALQLVSAMFQKE